jgi:transaldolase
LKVMKALTENHLTTIGTEQFIRDTKLMTTTVRDAISSKNPIVSADTAVKDAIVKMTDFGFGAIIVTNGNGSVKGVFTDGDLRRFLQTDGEKILGKKLGDLEYKQPVSIEADALLNDALAIFKKTNVDTIMVVENEKPVGMLDIQDLESN